MKKPNILYWLPVLLVVPGKGQGYKVCQIVSGSREFILFFLQVYALNCPVCQLPVNFSDKKTYISGENLGSIKKLNQK